MQMIRVFAVGALLFTTGCGDFKHWESRSPDGKATLTLALPRNLWKGVQVYLEENGRTQFHYSGPGDGELYLAEVFWTDDGGLVGVVTCGQPILRLGLDRKSGAQVPFSEVWPSMEARLRRRYGIPPSEKNVMRWVCGNNDIADNEFHDR